MTSRANGWLMGLLVIPVALFDVACTENSSTADAGIVTAHDEPGERSCTLLLNEELKLQAKEVTLGLWDKERGERAIVSFVMPDRAEFTLAGLRIVVAEVAGNDRERTAFISATGTGKDGKSLIISSPVGRFQYLGKKEYALGWTTRRTVTTVGRSNIQSVGNYDGSDFATGTQRNRMILFYEIK